MVLFPSFPSLFFPLIVMSGWKKKSSASQSSPQPLPGLLTPLEMYKLARPASGKARVKGVEATVPFQTECTLVDLSLNTRGNDEDREFAEDPMIRLNLRRGNTVSVVINPIEGGKYVDPSQIIYVKNKPHEITTAKWVRKGMRKFFDMCLPYVQQSSTSNLDSQGSFTGNFAKVYRGRDSYLEELRKVIFSEVEQSMIRDRVAIDVYKTNKANGENAQVAYSRELAAWIIASKNVSLAARTIEDLTMYSQSRYAFALLIAEEWFRLIAPLSAERVAQLQAVLADHTIVGEYVGHPDHQHLVRYTSKDILFYAYVDHNSADTCLPPPQAFSLFRSFGLSHVKATLYGSYSRPSDLYTAMESLFMHTSKEDINEGEEGSVLYFVRNEAPTREDFREFTKQVINEEEAKLTAEMQAEVFRTQHTLSLAKLKTLEYRIYRKLREKLKHFSAEKSVDDVFRVFKHEVKELIEGHELPRPLEFYHEVAKVALISISRNLSIQSKLQEHYIDFLDKIIARVGENEPISEGNEEGNREKVVEIVVITPPEVIPSGQIQSLAMELGYTYSRQKEYRENSYSKDKTLFHLLHAQKLSARFDGQTLIVHLGFENEAKKECLRSLGRVKASGIRIEDEEIERLVEGDVEEKVEKLWEDVHSREQQMLHVYPRHILVLGTLEGAVAAIHSRLSELQTQTTPRVSETPPQPLSTPTAPLPAQSTAPSGSKRVLVIIPMGIPGMGKTYLVQRLEAETQSLGCSFHIVSSDKVRRSLMEDYMERTHSRDLNKAFESTAKKAKTVFFDRVREGLRSNKPVHVLFIDKNHPPNAVSPTLKELESMRPKGVSKLELVALVPECSQKFRINRGNGHSEYELSLSFLVQCLKRTIEREDHETLVGSEAKKGGVVMMMYAMYRDVRFADYVKKGFDHVIRAPFTDESPAHFPEPLVDSITDLLSSLSVGSLPPESDVQPIVSALSHIPNVFKPINTLASALSALTAIIRRPPASVVSDPEPMQVDTPLVPVTPKKPEGLNLKQIPIFLGIDVEQWFGPALLPFVRSCLYSLSLTYSRDTDLKSDYEELTANMYARGYTSAEPLNSSWKYTNTLHLTTKFLGGGKHRPADPALSTYRVNEEVALAARIFAYVPQRIMCVLCDILTPNVQVENRFPHITCLLGKWAAKCSNDVLTNITFEGDLHKQTASICGESVTVYTIRMQPEWLVHGLTKAFY